MFYFYTFGCVGRDTTHGEELACFIGVVCDIAMCVVCLLQQSPLQVSCDAVAQSINAHFSSDLHSGKKTRRI
jgi:hypothetical protein